MAYEKTKSSPVYAVYRQTAEEAGCPPHLTASRVARSVEIFNEKVMGGGWGNQSISTHIWRREAVKRCACLETQDGSVSAWVAVASESPEKAIKAVVNEGYFLNEEPNMVNMVPAMVTVTAPKAVL